MQLGGIMVNLTNDELMNISGGGISAAFISAAARLVSTVYDIGRAFGSAIRRITSGNVCPL